jgi:DNA-binding protein
MSKEKQPEALSASRVGVKKIIIGSKSICSYIPAIMFELAKEDKVELSAIGSNINKLERLVKMFEGISMKPIAEDSRRTEKVNELDATVCMLCKKG